MCGITGAVWTDPEKAVEQETLRRMTDILRHRGPDDEGTYLCRPRRLPGREGLPGVALGHRRLAVIDVAGGHQPLCNEDGSVWVVLNGEIYNFRRLRPRLEGAGHRFRTRSDTETIVHLYEDAGPGLLEHLQGMFALAVWDARRGQLLLARDRLGQKPLVYRHEPGRLLFASELKSLLQVPDVPREVDPRSLDEYLTYQYVPHPRTIFRGIAKLPPGHYAVYRDDRLQIRRYWQVDFNVEEDQPAEEYARQLRCSLADSVRLRLQSEVPLGAFLSGGVDSTIVVGLMRELAGGPVRTFSIGFSVPEYDETRYARLAAERFETVHEEFRVEPNAVEILPKLVWHYDEPFADSSALPTWCLSRLARQQVTVALTGDGGDELFAGYPRYRAVWLAARFDGLPRGVRRLLAGRYWQRLPASTRQKSLGRRWKRFVRALSDTPRRRYPQWIAVFDEARRGELYTDEFVAALPEADPLEFLDRAFETGNRRDPVTATSLADLLTYLPCDLMTKVDVASMAHGLECRQPYLDHRLVELAMRMPRRLKFRRGLGKRVLLEAFADLLPRPVRRRGKMGFGAPLEHWFRNGLLDFAREILLSRRSLGRGYFLRDSLVRLIDDHQHGRLDHSSRLWSLLMLELWHRQWAEGG